jgi:hypothetical protein
MIGLARFRFLLCLLASCLLSLQIAAQTQIFVAPAPTGSDATGNGSIGNPYATIAKGAQIASGLIASFPTVPVDVLVRAGTYRNTGFTTTALLDANSYDPQNAGDAHWKSNSTAGTTVRLNNLHGNANAWLTVKP